MESITTNKHKAQEDCNSSLLGRLQKDTYRNEIILFKLPRSPWIKALKTHAQIPILADHIFGKILDTNHREMTIK